MRLTVLGILYGTLLLQILPVRVLDNLDSVAGFPPRWSISEGVIMPAGELASGFINPGVS